jgi:predicted esterase
MDYAILGEEGLEELAWFNMNQDFSNKYNDKVGFSLNSKYFEQEDIIDEADDLNKLIDEEIDMYFDKDPKRIFIGGITMGASMGLATYLRTNRQIGGIIALYGSNPLEYSNINNSTKKIDGVPMLFGNC